MKIDYEAIITLYLIYYFHICECTFKSAKYVKRNVIGMEPMTNIIHKKASLIECGGWCLSNEKCDGFKHESKKCSLYSNFGPYIKGYDLEAVDELRIVHGHPKFDWNNYNPLISSKILDSIKYNLMLIHGVTFQQKHF